MRGAPRDAKPIVEATRSAVDAKAWLSCGEPMEELVGDRAERSQGRLRRQGGARRRAAKIALLLADASAAEQVKRAP